MKTTCSLLALLSICTANALATSLVQYSFDNAPDGAIYAAPSSVGPGLAAGVFSFERTGSPFDTGVHYWTNPGDNASDGFYWANAITVPSLTNEYFGFSVSNTGSDEWSINSFAMDTLANDNEPIPAELWFSNDNFNTDSHMLSSFDVTGNFSTGVQHLNVAISPVTLGVGETESFRFFSRKALDVFTAFWKVDNVTVGAEAVPEPSCMVLLGAGLLSLTCARRRSVRK